MQKYKYFAGCGRGAFIKMTEEWTNTSFFDKKRSDFVKIKSDLLCFSSRLFACKAEKM